MVLGEEAVMREDFSRRWSVGNMPGWRRQFWHAVLKLWMYLLHPNVSHWSWIADCVRFLQYLHLVGVKEVAINTCLRPCGRLKTYKLITTVAAMHSSSLHDSDAVPDAPPDLCSYDLTQPIAWHQQIYLCWTKRTILGTCRGPSHTKGELPKDCRFFSRSIKIQNASFHPSILTSSSWKASSVATGRVAH